MAVKRKKAGIDIKVRNLEPVVVDKIEIQARKKGISREEYIRRYLAVLAASDEVIEVEDKYSRLIGVLSERLELSDTIIESNSEILKEIQRKLEEA